jgi:hypothetical protein
MEANKILRQAQIRVLTQTHPDAVVILVKPESHSLYRKLHRTVSKII